MKDLILDLLKENNIDVYLIQEDEVESSELFFVKKKLDLKRNSKTTSGSITVYRDFTKDGVAYRGDAVCMYDPSNTREELEEKLKRAYESALFVPNPAYEIAEKCVCEHQVMDSDLAKVSLEEAADRFVRALYAADIEVDENETKTSENAGFINSAEFFVTKTTCHVMNSNGVDVSYTKYKANGEFVVQCKAPEDVETYQDFSYDQLDCDQLTQKVAAAIQLTKDRAIAKNAPKTGAYDVILSDSFVSTIFSYYLTRANAGFIYPGYSDFKEGESVQGPLSEVTGDRLNLTYLPTVPFSEEGVPMKELACVEEGVLSHINSGCRMASYMKIKPTGVYRKVSCKPGTMAFSDMKAHKGLYIVNFSDFQMDPMTGHFGGEIRLAYLNDGTNITPVTGGSVNGSIFEAQKDFLFSKEIQSTSSLIGPKAVLLKNINVAGA